MYTPFLFQQHKMYPVEDIQRTPCLILVCGALGQPVLWCEAAGNAGSQQELTEADSESQVWHIAASQTESP